MKNPEKLAALGTQTKPKHNTISVRHKHYTWRK